MAAANRPIVKPRNILGFDFASVVATAATRDSVIHRRFEESRSAARRDGGLSAPLRARHQTGSWSGQRLDGRVPGCVHARAGPYARVCEEYAAVVRSQPSAGG